MTCENASPALGGLAAKEDWFVASQLSKAGCDASEERAREMTRTIA